MDARRLPPITRLLKIIEAMPNYSKASRGLFVQVGLGRVFTAIAISPSEPSRQLLARDTFRARLNLPDKELRLFRFKYFINIFTFACYLF